MQITTKHSEDEIAAAQTILRSAAHISKRPDTARPFVVTLVASE